MKLVKGEKKEQPKPNDQCPCGSKLKFKDCHGDDLKRKRAAMVANHVMMEMIAQEQVAKGICPQCKNDLDTKTRECKVCGLKVMTAEEMEAGKNGREGIVTPDKRIIVPR